LRIDGHQGSPGCWEYPSHGNRMSAVKSFVQTWPAALSTCAA
jgi:hypothetical protein